MPSYPELAEVFRDDSSWRRHDTIERGGELFAIGALDFYDVYWTGRAIIEFGEDAVRRFLERESRNISDGERVYTLMKATR